MEETKELLPSYNTFLHEKPQFECETASESKLPQKSTADCLSTFKEVSVKNNELCKLKSVDQNESVDFGKEVNVKTNNEILTKESVHNNIKEVVQLESTFNSKEASDANSINATLNKSADSDASSSDKEILQSRHPVQNNVYEDDHDSPTKSASFVSISDKESTTESTIDNEGSTVYNLELKKRPTIIQATVSLEKKSFNYKTSDSKSEINKQAAKSEYQETATGKANCSSLSFEKDISPIETESDFNQKSTKNDLNLDERRNENEIIQPQEEMMENDKNLNPDTREINDLDSDSIVQDFLNGSFNVSAFIPEKTSTMIEDKTIANQWQQMLEMSFSMEEKKYNRNVKKKDNDGNKKKDSLFNNKAERKKANKFIPDSFTGSTNKLKRKISEKQTENYKKERTEKSENEASNVMPDTLNKYVSKTENKYSKAKNQNKRVNKQLKYNDEDKEILKNIDKRDNINRKNKIKTNAAPTKVNKNEEIFKDLSFNISPVKKSRNLRNSSLIASKKIKDIGKFENSESFEEILIDSDASCFDFSIKKFDDCFKNMYEEHKNTKKYKQESKTEKDIFQNEDMDIILLDDFQPSFENEEKKERNRISRSNGKHKTNIENILDASHKTKKHKLNDDAALQENFILDTNLLDFEEENEETHENHHITKKPNNRPLIKNKRTENKLLEQGKSMNKLINWESEVIDKKFRPLTRSQKKTWDMLEKELLGESNDTLLSNNVTKSLLVKEQLIKKQNTKDADLYSISEKSVMHTISMPVKRNKCNEEKDLQNLAKKGKSDEIVPYKSKNIVEKTLAAMEKCTAKFITPEERNAEKERIEKILEFDTVYDANTDQEAEFHSNMTFVRNKNEQYYKNEFVTILKQCSSKKNENSFRNAAQATFKSSKYKQGFSNVEHLVKRSTVTENYSVEDKGGEKVETESRLLAVSTDKKQVDPWSRLIKELNLDQCNNEKKNSLESFEKTLNRKQNRKPLIYQENSKKHKDQNKDKEQQLKVDLDKREHYKQDETENEESEPEFFSFDKVKVKSNHAAIFNDLNIEDSYTNNENKNSLESLEKTSNRKQNRKPLIYQENSKKRKDQNKDKEQQLTVDLDKRGYYKQDEPENEESEPEFFSFAKVKVQSNHAAIFNDLNIEDSYNNNEFRIKNKTTELSNAFKTEKISKTAQKIEIEKKKVLLMKDKKSPKYKIHVEDNGSVKFKQCNRSLSSSSDESEKPKRENAKQHKFQKKQQCNRSSSDESEKPKRENAKQDKFQKKQIPGREKYKRYINDLLKKNALPKEKVKEDEKTKKVIAGEKSSKDFVEDKTTEERRMNNLLIAKNDDDVFSISSSDSETVNKGTGLLCDMFDE